MCAIEGVSDEQNTKMGSNTDNGSQGSAPNTSDAGSTSPYAIRVRSYCRSSIHDSDYATPMPFPILPVKPVEQGEKGPRPAICPLCLGELAGAYLPHVEQVAAV